MLVRELIELLSQMEQDSVVMMEQNGGEYVSDLESLEVRQGDGVVYLYD